ncbi:DUF924 family protein [Alteromonas lipotrueiana]|uniref:DUF924 family protein n=1 Tax=Alteromonas lipotrueiana TaxID=2803815 RepID=UPI001C43CF32|nr:DUF924 family protein [Alteromonas lipotrueiana]
MAKQPMITVEEAANVLAFWFEELEPNQWFIKDDSLDTLIRARFMTVHNAAAQCELWPWRATAYGRLAEIIVLDQFSRNIFRNKPEAFMHDSLALALAQEAVSVGADQHLSHSERAFLYMPFMHSESLEVHSTAMELFDEKGLQNNFEYEKKHKAILQRFGRYPHRNAILGRESTPEEKQFLTQPGSSF